jgi:hypothetical protein
MFVLGDGKYLLFCEAAHGIWWRGSATLFTEPS